MGGSSYDYGGGIYAGNNSNVTLTNSTISSNRGSYGSGIYVGDFSTVTLFNSTVSHNILGEFGSGIHAGYGSSLTLNNSISANTGQADCASYYSYYGDGSATVIVGADSIIQRDSCGTSATIADPLLGPLADNGGPTQTHALLTGSPAIDTGTGAGATTTDQRGFPALGTRDIGAYEFGVFDPNDFDSITLVDGRWTMVGLSKDAPSKTVADIFATTTPTGLASDDYGITWDVYGWDESTNSYVLLNLTDTLEQGKGYWIEQTTGADLEFAPDGAVTTVDDSDINCPSDAGCFEIDLVEGNGQFNLISHPFTADVKWKDIRVTVDGIVDCSYTYVLDTFWNYNGAAYDQFSTMIPPMGGGVFEAYKGYWVRTLAPSVGTDVKLLVPLGPVDDACSEPPAAASIEPQVEETTSFIAGALMNARAVIGRSLDRLGMTVGKLEQRLGDPRIRGDKSQDDTSLSFRPKELATERRNLHGLASKSNEESLVNARAALGDPATSAGNRSPDVFRGLHGLASDLNEEILLMPEQQLGDPHAATAAQDDSILLSLRGNDSDRGNPDNLPWWLSWINVADAAEDTTVKRGEWWVRLQAESPDEGGMIDQYNYLGWYRDSEDGKDRRDLRELQPFTSPYLTIVFRHDDWVEEPGDYSTDLRKKKHWRQGEEWDFMVKSDKAGREVTLSWEGSNNHKRFWRMRLVDMETGKIVRTVKRKKLKTYTFTTQGTEHRFKWVYVARSKKQ